MDRIKIKKRINLWYIPMWILLFAALYLAYGVYFVDLSSTKSKWVGLFAGSIAFLAASLKMLEINFYTAKNELSDKIIKYFTNGSYLFIRRLFKITLVFVLFASCFLIKYAGLSFVITFVSGCIFSFLTILCAVFITSKIAVRLSQCFSEAGAFISGQVLNSGIAISFFTVAFAIIPIVILYHITKDYQIMCGFALGCILPVLITNISIVISRQALKCANNVVCNFVAQISQNDKRNPLLLLSGLSKSILGVNLLSCDLFVSFVVALIATMVVGGEYLMLMGAFLPLIIAASSIFACIIVVLLTKHKNQNPAHALFISMFFANILFSVIAYYLIKTWYPDFMRLLIPIVLGAFGGYFMCFINANYIFSKYKPAVNVSNCTISGFETTFLQIVRESFSSVLLPSVAFVIVVVVSFVSAYGLEEPSVGVYGIMLAILSALSSMGILIAISVFGLITKSIDNILDSYEEDVLEKQNILANSLGNTGFILEALGGNFINSMSILTAICALVAYFVLGGLDEVDILNPYVMGALVFGCMVPFLYCSFVMGAISKTARRLVLEVKRQFRKSPQILRFEMRPDYEKCVDISALNSSVQVVFNTIFTVIFFLFVLFCFKKEALLAFVFGAILSAVGLIFISASTSNLSRCTKKYFESQFNCAKNTQEYDSVAISNQIFSSFKDIINPPLNLLIKFLAVLALSLAPFLIN